MNTASAPDSQPWLQRWRRLAAAVVRFYHAYAAWLVGISWKRFIVLSVLLLIGVQILQSLPPFRWSVTETIEDAPPIEPARVPVPPPAPLIRIEPPTRAASASSKGLSIQIDDKGIRITPAVEVSAASAAAAGASSGDSAAHNAAPGGLSISLPPGIVDKEAVRDAVQEARQAIQDAIEEQRQAAREAAQAAREAAAAQREAAASERAARRSHGRVLRVREFQWGDFLTQLSLLWVLGSAIIKATYKGRIQAEVKAAQATETAEAESLRRQVVEARMAAMQAQVEPHFLFNTLASIDHLIETDPPRASQMQKNLIALLRASMPTLREASDGGVRELGRELAVIRPYLEILKVRMEERLATQIDVSDGLLSAEFPPMMIQTLVENAIKHGLEPKPEGGSLTVRAEVVHGKLAVTVADTGLGFGRAATAGTGVGLANIRERLQLLYGSKASLTVAENQPCGTRVTVTVPYKTVEGASA
jgi:signal transduction histidine kinase